MKLNDEENVLNIAVGEDVGGVAGNSRHQG
jgi:hypothetical protein